MIVNSLEFIFVIELIRFSVGLSLLTIEAKTFGKALLDKRTLSLISSVFFLNLLFLLRLLGIYWNDPNLRQFGSATSGLVAAISLLFWGSLLIGLSQSKQRAAILGIFVGISGFFLGRILDINLIEALGVGLLCLTIASVIFAIFQFTFRKSPYLRARQRVFVMNVAWFLFIIFEGAGIVFMGMENYIVTALLFTIALFGRGLMTLSIILPHSLQRILSKFIN